MEGTDQVHRFQNVYLVGRVRVILSHKYRQLRKRNEKIEDCGKSVDTLLALPILA